MTIHFDCDEGFETEPVYEAVLSNVVEAVLDYEKCPYEAEVNIVLTGNEEIHRINKEFRSMDKPTDVLSFPVVQYENPSDFENLEENMDYFNPETGELLLGDIMISLEQARKQAEEYNHSLKRELAFLTAHSMLHLCGYDHIDEADRELMERKQKAVMGLLGITRENKKGEMEDGR